MIHSVSTRSAPQDIPSRTHDTWIDEIEDPFYSHGSMNEDLESGPSSYLQTPPSPNTIDIPSPLDDDIPYHSKSPLISARALHIELNDHLASLNLDVPSSPVIDLLTAGVGELARALDKRELTSVRAIKMYLAQIERLNGYLHALTYVAAREMLLEQARECDRIIRSEGFDRRLLPLCGIPVVVK